MKLLGLLISLLTLTSLTSMAADQKEPIYRHVVLFQFKKDVKKEKVEEAVKRFRSLKKDIKEIQSFEWGNECSPEGLAAGVTHCFLLSFKDQKSFNTYLHHAKHKEFVDFIKPLVEKPIVVDYTAKP